jgi:hypothetical protein
MTTISFHDEQEPFTPKRDRSAGFYRHKEEPVPIGEMEVPEEIDIPGFLAPDPLESVPSPLRILAEPGETIAALQARLWSLYLELNGKLMLKLASPEEIALHSRLHNDLHWIAPTIEGEA